MAKDALLEIYTEEIPVSFIPPALEQIKHITEQFLDENKLKYKNVNVYATPRRLVSYIDDLAEKSEKKTEKIYGPSANIAFDENNNPTKAALGFAKSHNARVEDLKVMETPKGKYICVEKLQPTLDAEMVLRDIFKKIILNISFPKMMVWEESKFRFVRPIRNILALYGNKVIKLNVAGVKSSNHTYGLYIISPKKIKILSPDKYLSTLRNNNVLVDHKFRRDTICKNIDNVIKTLKCRIADDPDLVSELNFLVEHPVVITGKFPEKFLTLPEEILTACMKKKQKFFPTLDAKGKITNYFVGLRNGISENQDVVREGYERVLVASLNDAKFFYEQDTKTTLQSKVDKLKGVIFHEKLGTVYDKVKRIKDIAIWLHKQLKDYLPQDINYSDIEKVSFFSKADLVTNLVYEYPELQGTAGKIYAEHDNEPKEITEVIEEHYRPTSLDGVLPATLMGTIVSLADKIDTIVGDFAVGLIPTGSGDPYGLRRQAIGILRIIRDKKLKVSLNELIKFTMSILPVESQTSSLRNVSDFFRQRLEQIFENEGYRFDEIRAVLDTGDAPSADDIPDTSARLEALKNIRSQPDFNPLITAYKRAGNILKQAQKTKIILDKLKIKEKLLKQEEERILYKEYTRVKSEVSDLFKDKKYDTVLLSLVSLRPSIDNFFDKILVMDENKKLRNNRLVLLQEVVELFARIGNLSLLQ
jgi:glycyl-tRNA synthetase beta chain